MKRKLMLLAFAITAYSQSVTFDGNKDDRNEQDRAARAFYSRYTASASRESWQRPSLVISALNLSPSELMAAFGDSDAYFTRQMTGLTSNVYLVNSGRALDAATKELPFNVIPVNGDVTALKSKGRPVDTVFVYDTLNTIPDHVAFFRSLTDLLKPQGRVVVIDFFKGTPPAGLPPEQRNSEATVTKEMAAAGFRLDQKFESLPFQFFLIFKR
ncbi:MAG: methyltransferase domain-containing protein [Bryobacteraceae bacterium]